MPSMRQPVSLLDQSPFSDRRQLRKVSFPAGNMTLSVAVGVEVVAEIHDRPTFVDSALFKVCDRAIMWSIDRPASECWVGAEGAPDPFGVVRPIRGDMPPAARDELARDKIDNRRLNEAPLEMPRLGPRVREKTAHARE